MPSELRKQYHQQLEDIEGRVIQLFAMVTEGLAAATEALLTGDREVIRVLAERDSAIDVVYRDVEELVNRNMALQAPVAEDLRFLLSVLRIAPELERSHDLVEHIARRGAQGLVEPLTPRARGLIDRMGTLGVEMWRLSADAWYHRDGSVAAVLEERDDEMDEMHAALCAEVAMGPLSLPVAMDMALVARFFERLGDHAVNISRRVVYLAGDSGATSPDSAVAAPAASDR